jgi:hypothetical protein
MGRVSKETDPLRTSQVLQLINTDTPLSFLLMNEKSRLTCRVPFALYINFTLYFMQNAYPAKNGSLA